jgi:uncharacterized BrkB/YihY/UPF0761 family membrane protein
MTRQEKLILFLVVLMVLMRFGYFGRDVLIARIYGASGPSPYDKFLWENASLFLGTLVNVGAGIWLYIEAKAVALKAWVWALLGLFFGLLGVVLFYVMQLYSRKHAKET